MYRAFFQDLAWQGLPLFALALFLAVFLVAVARVFIGRRARDFDHLACLPLREDP